MGAGSFTPGCLVRFCTGRYVPPGAADLRRLMDDARVTTAQAAQVAGVTGQTVRNWLRGSRQIPYSAWRLLVLELAPDLLP